ncbi:MAG: hypothetical protein ACREFE_07600 [Limisphaerales bacterium]
MNAEIISVVGALLVAAVTYWFSKRAEREAEWRKEKLKHYMAFVESLSRILKDEVTPEGQIAFAKACNDILLFAPQYVIEALMNFQDEIKVSNKKPSLERHDELLSKLFLVIRRDIGIKPNDDETTFKVRLWASGVKKV